MMKRLMVLGLIIVCGLVLTVQAQEKLNAGDSPATGKQELAAKAAVVKDAGLKSKEAGQDKAKEAVVSVPSLNEDIAKKITILLKKSDGVKSMKPDYEKKNIHVIFSADQDFEAGILKQIQQVDEQSKVVEIKDAAVITGGKCGGCPHAAKCAGAEKAAAGAGKTGETKVEEKSTKTGM